MSLLSLTRSKLGTISPFEVTMFIVISVFLGLRAQLSALGDVSGLQFQCDIFSEFKSFFRNLKVLWNLMRYFRYF